MNTRVSRSQTETYKIFIENHWQATITIEDSSGLLLIQSEYGHFSHYWGTSGRAKGNTFKQELLRFGLDYIENKLGYNDDLNRHFYSHDTVKRIRQDIIRKRREGIIDGLDSRQFWQSLDGLERCQNSNEFYSNMDDDLLDALYGGDPFNVPFISGTHPRLKEFVKEIYPIFKAELAKEQICLETA